MSPPPLITRTSELSVSIGVCEPGDYEIVVVLPEYFEASSVPPEYQRTIDGNGVTDHDLYYLLLSDTIGSEPIDYSFVVRPRWVPTTTRANVIEARIHPHGSELRDGAGDLLRVRVGTAMREARVWDEYLMPPSDLDFGYLPLMAPVAFLAAAIGFLLWRAARPWRRRKRLALALFGFLLTAPVAHQVELRMLENGGLTTYWLVSVCGVSDGLAVASEMARSGGGLHVSTFARRYQLISSDRDLCSGDDGAGPSPTTWDEAGPRSGLDVAGACPDITWMQEPDARSTAVAFAELEGYTVTGTGRVWQMTRTEAAARGIEVPEAHPCLWQFEMSGQTRAIRWEPWFLPGAYAQAMPSPTPEPFELSVVLDAADGAVLGMNRRALQAGPSLTP